MIRPLTVLLMGALATPASADPGVAYDLRPFAETAPVLVRAADVLDDPDGSQAEVDAAIQDLARWRTTDHADVIAGATADWLLARAASRVADQAGSLQAWRYLLTGSTNAFSDDARAALAAMTREPAVAAELLLQQSVAADGESPALRAAIDALVASGRGAEAKALLQSTLRSPRSAAQRRAMTTLLAGVLTSIDDKAGARAVLHAAWWRSRKEDRPAIATQLTALGAKISPWETLARPLFGRLSKSRRKALSKKIKRTRFRGRAGRAVRDWFAAMMVDRRDDAAVKKALKTLARREKAVVGHAFQPLYQYGKAELLRRVDRDAEAIELLTQLADEFDDHPLAPDALNLASKLLRYLGRDAEALAVDTRLAERADHAESVCDALWRAGFDAFQAARYDDAERLLGRLEAEYGGERDAYAISWAAPARYWRGRAAAAAGDLERANRDFHIVASRFPAGWYGMQARQRLGIPPPAEDDTASPRVARVPVLDTAVALTRLDRPGAAVAYLERLLRAQQLPGAGRDLLAWHYEQGGDSKRAASVRRRFGIPARYPVPPAEDEAASIFTLDHREVIEEVAKLHGLQPQLVAAICHVESRFEARARSGAGAWGIAQLHRGTGMALGRKLFGKRFRLRQLFNPETNLKIAAHYLERLAELLGTAHPVAILAAYNAGNGPTSRWLAARGHLAPDVFIETIPYSQARRYVKRVLAIAEIYRNLYALGDAPVALPDEILQ